MIIKNARVFTEYGAFESSDISIEGDRFSASASDSTVLDATGCYAIPGLTDIHFHGCVGHDFCDGSVEAITAMAEYEAKNGVTSICPATMTLPEETLMNVCRAAKEYTASGVKTGASLVGINMEGPFISLAKKGAQNADYIHRPDTSFFRRLQDASGGLFKLVAIAPEEEGALELISALKDEVVLSIAHTTADYDASMAAIERGASHVTHLYNAMPPFSHRAPGVIGAACDGGCEVELICDGVHIHPAVVRTSFKMFGSNRVILISDSMMATGMDDGQYSLGGQAVTVVGNRATLADGTIAGSATNLMDCLRTAVQKMDIPLETAVTCAAVNPALSIGIYGEYGSITPGKYANVVLLDQSLAIKHVILNGQVL